jgi:single-strand DNA-binding protein
VNKVFLIGNLGADPELRYSGNQTPVTSFSIATSKKVKDKEYVTWHRIVTWGKSAENCQKYLFKGSKVLIEGEISVREWTNKEGKKNYAHEVTAHKITFMSPPKGVKEDIDHGDLSEEDQYDDIPF